MGGGGGEVVGHSFPGEQTKKKEKVAETVGGGLLSL